MIDVVRVFRAEELLPDEWRGLVSRGPVSVFNPAIHPRDGGWVLAFRVGQGEGVRKIGFCRLDASFSVVPGSPAAWSDGVRFPPAPIYSDRERSWFADPRLVVLEGRWFVQWNTGWHDPINRQFLQEIDPASLSPIGSPRELVFGGRRPLEKNWMLFGADPCFAVYSVRPHRILRFQLQGSGPIECAEAFRTDWDDAPYASRYGELRGGAPPVRVGDSWFSWCHSVFGAPGNYRYVAALYAFGAEPPFAPVAIPHRPSRWNLPDAARRRHPKLNPAVGEVVYPSGSACQAGRWVVSFGIDDENCAIAAVPHAEATQELHVPALR